jgi:hypothetical protein
MEKKKIQRDGNEQAATEESQMEKIGTEESSAKIILEQKREEKRRKEQTMTEQIKTELKRIELNRIKESSAEDRIEHSSKDSWTFLPFC